MSFVVKVQRVAVEIVMCASRNKMFYCLWLLLLAIGYLCYRDVLSGGHFMLSFSLRKIRKTPLQRIDRQNLMISQKLGLLGKSWWCGNECFRKLRKIIPRKRFVQSLNDRTKYVMLLEYILNSVSLATGLIQLLVADTASGLISLLCIILLVVTQIFILAWSANEICIAGLGVADAIFASDWTGQSNEVKKLLLIMIMRAQIPLGLTAGPFFQMRTTTALTTVKIAYSYVSFMSQSVG